MSEVNILKLAKWTPLNLYVRCYGDGWYRDGFLLKINMDKTSQKVTKDKDPKRVDAGRKSRENFMKKNEEKYFRRCKKKVAEILPIQAMKLPALLSIQAMKLPALITK